MNYLSVCSGIEAATVAWHHMGWQPVGFAEIEKFPAQVLAHHYPNVRNYGDLTKHDTWGIEAGSVDLLVGGTPCQAFSVAGLRRGMDDARGQLTLEFVRLAQWLRPRWIVWENVPGVLSSGGGRDFGSFLGALAQLGYGYAYRVLDAQYFGVAQRRRRVFVVGYLGDWRRAAAVLLERESVRGNPAPRREARESIAADTASSLVSSGRGVARTGESRGQDPVVAVPQIAGSIGSRASSGGGFSTDFECAGGLQVVGALDCRIGAQRAQNAQNGHYMPVAKCITRGEGYRYDFETTTLLPIVSGIDLYNQQMTGEVHCPLRTAGGHGAPAVAVPVAFSAKDHGADAGELAPTLRAMGHGASHANGGGQLAVATFQQSSMAGKGTIGYETSGTAKPVKTQVDGQMLHYGMAVRRLTPVECERLQGFPDGYTDIRPRGKDTPDGPRYKALGNSMAVPVMRWIGERIAAVDKL